MRSNDVNLTRDTVRAQLQQAVRDNDPAAFSVAMDNLSQVIGNEIRADYDQQMEDLRQEMDSRILSARGVRQLTSEERSYYNNLLQAMRSADPRQAVTNMTDVMPRTVIEAVFEDLRTEHPLLSKINFIPTYGAVEMIVNTDGYQEAVWGDLTDEIVKEALSGFKKIKTDLKKLSAFILVAKAMLDLGPEWLDRYVREVLYEMLANGLEAGIVDGPGSKGPIGMTRQVGDNVTVTGGVYPRKTPIKVSDLSPATVGKLLALLSVSPYGKPRKVQDIIFLCHPVDYYAKVMPATTVMAPDGTYRNDVMPVPMSVMQTMSLDSGLAIIGLGRQYAAFAGTAKEGKIEYSDHARFLQDERAYVVKAYANGLPKDDNSFLLLDISDLQPMTWKVEQTTPAAASSDAALAGLKIGSLTLEPAFEAGTKSYTASTTNASNTITALPADAGADVVITVGDTVVENGTAVTWNPGANTVKVDVTAADGTTTDSYTVTVTKS